VVNTMYFLIIGVNLKFIPLIWYVKYPISGILIVIAILYFCIVNKRGVFLKLV